GNGGNTVNIGDTLSIGNLTLNTGNGADTVNVTGNAHVSGNVSVNLGAGDDTFNLLTFDTANASVRMVVTGNFSLNAGAGNDSVTLAGLTVNGSSLIDLGASIAGGVGDTLIGEAITANGN